jgi:hypothetical protein
MLPQHQHTVAVATIEHRKRFRGSVFHTFVTAAPIDLRQPAVGIFTPGPIRARLSGWEGYAEARKFLGHASADRLDCGGGAEHDL